MGAAGVLYFFRFGFACKIFFLFFVLRGAFLTVGGGRLSSGPGEKVVSELCPESPEGDL